MIGPANQEYLDPGAKTACRRILKQNISITVCSSYEPFSLSDLQNKILRKKIKHLKRLYLCFSVTYTRIFTELYFGF
jgi:hypothetical protein